MTKKTVKAKQVEKAAVEEKGKGFYEHKPINEFKAQLSKDGRFWIFKDIRTHLVPVEYLDKISANPSSADPQGIGDKGGGLSNKVE